MSDFKKIIQENKAQLEEEFDTEAGWKEIKNRFTPVKKMPNYWAWAAAASVVLMLGVGGYYFTNKPADNQPVSSINRSTIVKPAEPKTTKKHPERTSPQKDFVATVPPKLPQPNIHHRTKTAKPESLDQLVEQSINQELKWVRNTAFYGENPHYFAPYKKAFMQYEKEESTLKMDIQAYGLDADKLDQLMAVYQQKLSLLKQLRAEMKVMNRHFRRSKKATKKVFIDI